MEKVVKNTTCFSEHEKRGLACQNTNCRQWMNCKSDLNCAVIASQNDNQKTLQEIGDIFGVTRMRICQIEKAITEKLKSNTSVKF